MHHRNIDPKIFNYIDDKYSKLLNKALEFPFLKEGFIKEIRIGLKVEKDGSPSKVDTGIYFLVYTKGKTDPLGLPDIQFDLPLKELEHFYTSNFEPRNNESDAIAFFDFPTADLPSVTVTTRSQISHSLLPSTGSLGVILRDTNNDSMMVSAAHLLIPGSAGDDNERKRLNIEVESRHVANLVEESATLDVGLDIAAARFIDSPKVKIQHQDRTFSKIGVLEIGEVFETETINGVQEAICTGIGFHPFTWGSQEYWQLIYTCHKPRMRGPDAENEISYPSHSGSLWYKRVGKEKHLVGIHSDGEDSTHEADVAYIVPLKPALAYWEHERSLKLSL